MEINQIKSNDAELYAAMASERERQEYGVELIASENYASPAVMEAQGSVLTNKYAEGYPSKRYYGGCVNVDAVEELAIERLKKLYGVEYANVQPHSGAQANACVFYALLELGDRIMGLDLAHGGHLTHGSKVNFSGNFYQSSFYEVDDDGYIDYDAMEARVLEHKPKLLIGGFSAYSRILDWAKIREIADKVGAYLLIDMAHISGLVAAGVYPSPVDYADVVTSTTHKTLRGPRGGIIISKNQDLAKKLQSGVFPGVQAGPLMHVIAGKAVAFKEALEPSFVDYQKQVIANARTMAEIVISRGYKVVTGGTDNHMFLVDLIEKDLTGKDANGALENAHITVNKNTVPNDPESPFVTSGIRIGTPASTTRGFGKKEVSQVAQWICDVLDNHADEANIQAIGEKVKELCQSFPVYSASSPMSSSPKLKQSA